MMSHERLAEIRALVESASPRPWTRDISGVRPGWERLIFANERDRFDPAIKTCQVAEATLNSRCNGDPIERAERNAELISRAPVLIVSLLDEILELQAEHRKTDKKITGLVNTLKGLKLTFEKASTEKEYIVALRKIEGRQGFFVGLRTMVIKELIKYGVKDSD